MEFKSETIDLIMSEKFDINFWYYNLGESIEIEERIDEDKSFMYSFYDLGLEVWDKYKKKLKTTICDIDNLKPKDWVEDIISGDRRELVIAILTLLVGTLSIKLMIAVPLVAILLKKGLTTFCIEN